MGHSPVSVTLSECTTASAYADRRAAAGSRGGRGRFPELLHLPLKLLRLRRDLAQHRNGVLPIFFFEKLPHNVKFRNTATSKDCETGKKTPCILLVVFQFSGETPIWLGPRATSALFQRRSNTCRCVQDASRISVMILWRANDPRREDRYTHHVHL